MRLTYYILALLFSATQVHIRPLTEKIGRIPTLLKAIVGKRKGGTIHQHTLSTIIVSRTVLVIGL
jgi:hypothetical protein